MEASSLTAVPGQLRAVRRVAVHLPRYSLPGTTGAVIFGCASFTPSLLPRDWVLQGAVDGLSAAFGYGVGVGLGWLAGALTGRHVPAALLRRLWLVAAGVGLPLVGVSMWWGQHWQRQIHELTGAPPPRSYAWVQILLLSVLVFAVVVAFFRALGWVVRRVAGWLRRFVPDHVAGPTALLIVTALLLTVTNGVLERALMNALDSSFGSVNSTTNAGTVQPLAPERSGSPASLVSWASLGRQGRDFVAHGPTTADLAAFSGATAREPVRVYVGLRSAPDPRARAALAVRELRRTGGFDREVVVVATTTGTGLVDPAAVDSIEYMYDGDTAVVAMQYSYLPSWISFLSDHERAEQAGRLLFDRVYAAWSALPPGERPRLLVTGSSLGALGGEAAFHGLQDVRRRTDGVVWAGPPHAASLHHALTAQRDPGSPSWLPVYHQGRTVRFASSPADLRRPDGPWGHPRAVYLQNGSDPVRVWTPRLAFTRPDWLAERSAPDVSPDMAWIPVVTFWQVTADLPFALDAPAGHGHSYRQIFVDAWAAVAPPQDWTARDTQRLRGWLTEEWSAASRPEVGTVDDLRP